MVHNVSKEHLWGLLTFDSKGTVFFGASATSYSVTQHHSQKMLVLSNTTVSTSKSCTVFFLTAYMFLPHNNYCSPEADVFHPISVPSSLLEHA